MLKKKYNFISFLYPRLIHPLPPPRLPPVYLILPNVQTPLLIRTPRLFETQEYFGESIFTLIATQSSW